MYRIVFYLFFKFIGIFVPLVISAFFIILYFISWNGNARKYWRYSIRCCIVVHSRQFTTHAEIFSRCTRKVEVFLSNWGSGFEESHYPYKIAPVYASTLACTPGERGRPVTKHRTAGWHKCQHILRSGSWRRRYQTDALCEHRYTQTTSAGAAVSAAERQQQLRAFEQVCDLISISMLPLAILIINNVVKKYFL